MKDICSFNNLSKSHCTFFFSFIHSYIDRSLEYVNALMIRPCPSVFTMAQEVLDTHSSEWSSKLNFHLFSLHVVDSPACPCGHDWEDSNHYLLQSPLFYLARMIMINEIKELTMTDISCELLLYGSAKLGITINKKVFGAVHPKLEDCNL